MPISTYFPVGIDLGTQTVFTACYTDNRFKDHNKVVSLVLDAYSNRKVTNAFYFRNGCRDIGVISHTHITSNIMDSVLYFTQFIGKAYESIPNSYKYLFPYLACKNNNKEAYINLKSVGDISLEHAYAMMVNHCISIVKRNHPKIDPYIVVSVPSFSTANYINNISLAMAIAQQSHFDTLKCSLASALDFIFFKNKNGEFNSYSQYQPFTFFLIDLGYYALECSLFYIWKDHIQYHNFTFRENCGGHHFTWIMFMILKRKYEEKFGPFPVNNNKLALSLYFQAESVKHDISIAGVDQVSVVLDNEKRDDSITFILTADEVEEAIKQEGVFIDIEECIDNCLQYNKFIKLDRVECIGGSSRIRGFKQHVETILKKRTSSYKMSCTLNADETIANGCTLYASYKANDYDRSQQALFECIQSLNVPYALTESYIQQPESLIQIGLQKEQELAEKHEQYQVRSRLINTIDGLLIDLNHLLKEISISTKDKQYYQEQAHDLSNILTMKSSSLSIIELEKMEGAIHIMLNKHNNKKETFTIFTYEKGCKRYIHSGLFYHGLQNGQGLYDDNDIETGIHSHYKGEWKDGKMEGNGIYTQESKSSFILKIGSFVNNKQIDGSMIEVEYPSNLIYKSKICSGKDHITKVYNAQQQLLYKGFLINKKKNGFGTSYYPNTNIKQYTGYYKNNMREGRGTSFNRNGTSQYTGQWHQDEYIGE